MKERRYGGEQKAIFKPSAQDKLERIEALLAFIFGLLVVIVCILLA